MIEWKRYFEPISSGDIEACEQCIGMLLPPVYRSYLLSENGGSSLKHAGFVVPELNEKVMLGALYGIGKPSSSLNLATAFDEYKDLLPGGLLPIGEDPGGNQLLLSTEGEEAEVIFFWDRVGLFERRMGKNLFRVADNMNQFIQSLEIDP